MLRRNNNTKAEKAYTFLLSEITSGKIPLGSRLASERDLSSQLNISRLTLRESLRALCNAGFLETKRGGGTYVISNEDPFPAHSYLGGKDISSIEILQARITIEPEAAKLAAQFATAQDLENILACKEKREHTIQKQLSEDSEEVDALHDADTDFHRSIVLASHNTILLGFFDSMRESLLGQQQLASTKIDMFEHSSKFHNKIYEAIANRNPTEAARTMKKHLEDIEKVITSLQSKHKTSDHGGIE